MNWMDLELLFGKENGGRRERKERKKGKKGKKGKKEVK